MRRALKALISLYPKTWRNRYQNEFCALLDDVPPTWRTLFNVFGGALKMQMTAWSPWKIVAAFAVVGAIAAIAFSLAIPSEVNMCQGRSSRSAMLGERNWLGTS